MRSGFGRATGRLKLNSLRSRLMLLVALALMPLAVMTILSGIREREHAIRQSEENLRRLTGMAAANESQSIEGARQILAVLMHKGIAQGLVLTLRGHRARRYQLGFLGGEAIECGVSLDHSSFDRCFR